MRDKSLSMSSGSLSEFMTCSGVLQAFQPEPCMGMTPKSFVPCHKAPPGVKAHAILGLFQIEVAGRQDLGEGGFSALPRPDDCDGGPVGKRGPNLRCNEPPLHFLHNRTIFLFCKPSGSSIRLYHLHGDGQQENKAASTVTRARLCP
jgi:hypothetical protein